MLADTDASRMIGGPKRCLLIEMTGGPSQLDSFDPKPAARREIRGPLRSISTVVPGLQFTEGFPRLAELADQLLVVRSLYHDAAPIHETGLQWIRLGSTGSRSGRASPLEQVVNQAWSTEADRPAALRLSPCLEDERTIERLSADSSASETLEGIDPACVDILRNCDAADVRQRYGNSPLALRLHISHRLLRQGIRFITVPMFAAPESPGTWDIHGHKPSKSGTAFDYGGRLGRGFDQSVASFLQVLRAEGLLNETMVVCVGEMGRTPKLNAAGGRDHWTGCWSAIVAGGGVPGGVVIGRSDATGAAPVDRPVHLRELMAAIVHQLGINPLAEVAVGTGTRPLIGCRAMSEIVG
jgi:hypothetical protein